VPERRVERGENDGVCGVGGGERVTGVSRGNESGQGEEEGKLVRDEGRGTQTGVRRWCPGKRRRKGSEKSMAQRKRGLGGRHIAKLGWCQQARRELGRKAKGKKKQMKRGGGRAT